ncbi:hypothetical protein P175DRAFT_0426728 [Aspergillus ochraceoroseus IBT 24754]|uniref:Sugar phosphate transporter domain-containing protein n=1 Tax=Aspergillus ochraceoroseus IBT 24754 TaxID=1392256 RepID=A0A2T5M5I2_9EURO|nr:uncharacterized protein P175DRAFT_0426728 [Aspergillus ochraceoroseus IBT 24754]PTU23756.1 hypothetical protein P175DRAFT_0426728 [Aspergillus ochraceoroseus IBT 24754]
MLEGKGFEEPLRASLVSIVATAAQTTLSQWTSVLLMISLIFGGCCANVGKYISNSRLPGPLITFAQFILTALFMVPNFLSLSAGPRSFFISTRSIPLRSWFIYTAFFVTVNLLNNWAFAYKISVPLHIIVRSGGPVASMIVGRFHASKRYSHGQMLAVAMLTLGVVTSALADAQAKGQSISIGIAESTTTLSTTSTGFAMLALAMVLSAFQGIYADKLYETYGRSHWKEALFYSHILSLPLFLPTFPQLLGQWRILYSSPSLLSRVVPAVNEAGYLHTIFTSDGTIAPEKPCVTSATTPILSGLSYLLVAFQESWFFQSIFARIPVQVFYLILNALTQYWCIRGVHLLSAKSSSLTVTIVLNIRKLVSLLLSIHIFGNALSHGVLIGAILVFVGGAMYGFEGARLRRITLKRD